MADTHRNDKVSQIWQTHFRNPISTCFISVMFSSNEMKIGMVGTGYLKWVAQVSHPLLYMKKFHNILFIQLLKGQVTMNFEGWRPKQHGRFLPSENLGEQPLNRKHGLLLRPRDSGVPHLEKIFVEVF